MKRKMKVFGDGKRRRRLVTHQTDVNKFLRILAEDGVHYIFGNILTELNRKIRKEIIGGSKMRFIVDNSEYPRYGMQCRPFDIGTVRIKGAKTCWLIQGHSLHGCGMNLFAEFYLLKKGKYRSKEIPPLVVRQRNLGWNLSYALLDREFYRASLIIDLQKLRLPVIIPAKKFPKVKKVIRKYLFRIGPLARPYWLKQGSGAKPYPKMAKLKLVLIGHKHVGAWSLRADYKNKIGYDDAINNMAGFLTTMAPWSNLKRWSVWLSKTYKNRWNIETGFSKLNEIHKRFRCRSPIVFLAFTYMRAYI